MFTFKPHQKRMFLFVSGVLSFVTGIITLPYTTEYNGFTLILSIIIGIYLIKLSDRV